MAGISLDKVVARNKGREIYTALILSWAGVSYSITCQQCFKELSESDSAAFMYMWGYPPWLSMCALGDSANAWCFAMSTPAVSWVLL